MIALPVTLRYHQDPNLAQGDIDLQTIHSGPNRDILGKQNGVSHMSHPIDDVDPSEPLHPIEITSTPRIALPTDLVLIIVGGIRVDHETGEWVEVRHANSTMLKPRPVNSDKPYTHELRFETYGEDGLPDYILCDAYRFMYDPSERSSE
jgi:hypothetical protein